MIKDEVVIITGASSGMVEVTPSGLFWAFGGFHITASIDSYRIIV